MKYAVYYTNDKGKKCLIGKDLTIEQATKLTWQAQAQGKRSYVESYEDSESNLHPIFQHILKGI
jgi:hypothetical protein